MEEWKLLAIQLLFLKPLKRTGFSTSNWGFEIKEFILNFFLFWKTFRKHEIDTVNWYIKLCTENLYQQFSKFGKV